MGNEASPSYCFLWLDSFRRCARVLERCAPHRDHDLHRDYPRLERMYAAPYRLTVLDTYSLHVADMEQTGNPGMASVHLTLALEGFRRTGDPSLARLARAQGGVVRGMGSPRHLGHQYHRPTSAPLLSRPLALR